MNATVETRKVALKAVLIDCAKIANHPSAEIRKMCGQEVSLHPECIRWVRGKVGKEIATIPISVPGSQVAVPMSLRYLDIDDKTYESLHTKHTN